MNPSSNYYAPDAAWQRLARLLIALALVIFVANTAWSIYLRQSTGSLVISTFANNATISISGDNKEAKVIGTGSANVRLKSGRYQVVASGSGAKGIAYISVQSQRTTKLEVKKITAPIAPSPNDILMTGIAEFLNRGITQEQILQLQKLFFAYKQNTSEVVVDSASITSGTRTPDSGEPFTLNFNASIDNVTFRAVIAYNDLENVRLSLYDPKLGTQLFSKSSED